MKRSEVWPICALCEHSWLADFDAMSGRQRNGTPASTRRGQDGLNVALSRSEGHFCAAQRAKRSDEDFFPQASEATRNAREPMIRVAPFAHWLLRPRVLSQLWLSIIGSVDRVAG